MLGLAYSCYGRRWLVLLSLLTLLCGETLPPTWRLFGVISVSRSVSASGTSLDYFLATKFLIGAGVGIPAASLCIQRRLFKIATMQTVTITRQDVSPLCR